MQNAQRPSSDLRDVPAQWPVVSSRVAYESGWVIDVVEEVITAPDKPEPTFTRVRVSHPGAVIVLAVDDDERVLCLSQYRHISQHVFVELPAGLRDAGDEPPIETAKRELREEAELAAAQWRQLLSTYPSAGLTNEVHEIFLARELSHAPRGNFALEHEEAEMEVFWTPMAHLLDAVLDGRVRQGPLAQAVLAYDVLKRRGEL